MPPGLLATAIPADLARRFDSPSINPLKEYVLLSWESILMFRIPGITKGFLNDGSFLEIGTSTSCGCTLNLFELGICSVCST